MKLYKFLPKRYLDAFFENGSIRLGTIFDFNDIVKHTVARADSGEGKHTLQRKLEGKTIHLKEDAHEEIISEAFFGNVTITGHGSVSSMRSCDDAFIYCTSNRYTDEIFKKWNDDDTEINSCFEIFNVRSFFKQVSKAIKFSAYPLYGDNVIYTPDPIPYDSYAAKLNPAITKEKEKYSWQRENRSIWSPRYPYSPLKPWVINVPNAREFCRPYAKLDSEGKHRTIHFL
jgi:hypothetical protein